MPCIDGREGTLTSISKEELNKLTRMLCEAMNIVEKYFEESGFFLRKGDVSDELFKWWRQHKTSDKKRKGRD